MTPLAFSEALTRAAAQASRALPGELASRIAAAQELVRQGSVFQTSEGTWTVNSTTRQGLTYSVNGSCNCDDCLYNKPPQGLCKHRISVYLSRRVVELMQQPPAPVVPEETAPPVEREPTPGDSTVPEVTPAPAGIDPRFVVTIQGKPFVKFAGLLQMAHERGLQALKVDWTYNDAALSLAHASAAFPFGTFEESGDATPDNVNRKVAPHFRRCALTRASARCLRLALGLDMVAVEELADEEGRA